MYRCRYRCWAVTAITAVIWTEYHSEPKFTRHYRDCNQIYPMLMVLLLLFMVQGMDQHQKRSSNPRRRKNENCVKERRRRESRLQSRMFAAMLTTIEQHLHLLNTCRLSRQVQVSTMATTALTTLNILHGPFFHWYNFSCLNTGPSVRQVKQVEVVTFQDPRKKLKTKQTPATDKTPVSRGFTCRRTDGGYFQRCMLPTWMRNNHIFS